jgi:hypothetical protein
MASSPIHRRRALKIAESIYLDIEDILGQQDKVGPNPSHKRSNQNNPPFPFPSYRKKEKGDSPKKCPNEPFAKLKKVA